MLLFGRLNPAKPTFEDDVVSARESLESVEFERPLILATELHVAGAMAFASSYGVVGYSLVEWALLQSLDSAASRLSAEGSGPNSRRD